MTVEEAELVTDANHSSGMPRQNTSIEDNPAPADLAMPLLRSGRTAFIIKWVASVMQILGYTATAFDLTPWNAYLFLGGLTGWLIVGVLWNDRSLMLIHAVALVAMFAGLSSR